MSNVCSVCGKFTKTGGLCYEHGGAYYSYYEEMKGRLEDEKQERDS